MSENLPQTIYNVLTAIRGADDLRPLLNIGYALVKANGGKLTILVVRLSAETPPEWLKIPGGLRDIPIETKIAQSESTARVILREARRLNPNLLLLGWRGDSPRRGYLLGSTLDHVIQQVTCNLAVVRADPTWPDESFGSLGISGDTTRYSGVA